MARPAVAAAGGTADCGCVLTVTVAAMVTVTAMASAARVTIDRLPLCVVALECTFGSEHLPCSTEWTADAAARQAAVQTSCGKVILQRGRVSLRAHQFYGALYLRFRLVACMHDSLTHHMARTASCRPHDRWRQGV